VHVSVSIGVAALEEGVRDLDALIALADNRVFAAKGAGRDRVVATSSV
jgi:PleD family two-component response regulator